MSWDEYFLAVSILSSQRSKDPSTQVLFSIHSTQQQLNCIEYMIYKQKVGACIVNREFKIVGIGYNGFPKNCSDDLLPWSRTSSNGSILDTKYPFGIRISFILFLFYTNDNILQGNFYDLETLLIWT